MAEIDRIVIKGMCSSDSFPLGPKPDPTLVLAFLRGLASVSDELNRYRSSTQNNVHLAMATVFKASGTKYRKRWKTNLCGPLPQKTPFPQLSLINAVTKQSFTLEQVNDVPTRFRFSGFRWMRDIMTLIRVEIAKSSASNLDQLSNVTTLMTMLQGSRFQPASEASAKAMHKVLTILADKGDFFTAMISFQEWVQVHSSRQAIIDSDTEEYLLQDVPTPLPTPPPPAPDSVWGDMGGV
ncbi:hypothetical protein BCR44DRAFT_1432893 [Catenaria anguillulae PL171]|nr:hypothetical protein BCR44DRAFT_1432893 [Catenaria anguillulae PL171]